MYHSMIIIDYNCHQSISLEIDIKNLVNCIVQDNLTDLLLNSFKLFEKYFFPDRQYYIFSKKHYIS